MHPPTPPTLPFDVVTIGAGIAGMATAARLQAQGLSTLVIEAHSHIGGCAGYFRRRGFAFDVGATTLVDFEPDGVGGELLTSIGMSPIQGEALPGYVAWLPDRVITLYRDHTAWAKERLEKLGDSAVHLAFWTFLDQLSQRFWQASRSGIKLPMQSLRDVVHNLSLFAPHELLLARYLNWTMGDALRHFGLRDDKPLVSLLAMLIEDTVHSTIDEAPLINSALGITIRGAGLMRHQGGMYGFWKRFLAHYHAIGGQVITGCRAEQVDGQYGAFRVTTSHGVFTAKQVVSAIPIALTAKIAPPCVGDALAWFLKRDADKQGAAVVVFLGVPEAEVQGQDFTHHQLLQDYDLPLGMGNNMFISVSAPDDTESAPAGYRAVMISTHCDLSDWQSLSPQLYPVQKQAVGECLLEYARRVYPQLGKKRVVYEIGTPLTYAKFTSRPDGAVGGVRQTLANSNQHAVPHNLIGKGFWLAGDTTWPGLGTVAGVLGSRIVAEEVLRYA